INSIDLRSSGEDGAEGTADDFGAASYSRIVAEQATEDPAPRLVTTTATFAGTTGALTGVVLDPMGAVITSAVIKATNTRFDRTYESRTDESGRYLIENLPAGIYEVRIEATGFQSTTITDVPISSSNVTELNSTLMVGSTT